MKGKSHTYRCLFIPSLAALFFLGACHNSQQDAATVSQAKDSIPAIDTSLIPKDKFGDYVRYGRELMLRTAYYIGPEGINGQYLGNKMNCSNCHQEAGTKPYSLNLMPAHDIYPQYRAREGKVLSLAERVNNCVMRPHNGKPLPLESREMISILSYLKWINSFVPKGKTFPGAKNASIVFPDEAASPERGSAIYSTQCSRCHGAEGLGMMNPDSVTYLYPPLWGPHGYQPGSSMHRNIKMAQWIKSNMPHNEARWDKPVLTDKEALDVAAFINDDRIHYRPHPKTLDFPNIEEKPIDYHFGPFFDTFPEINHQLGPFQPIVKYWESKGMKPVY